jgi:enterobacterial common antigen flippase
MSVDGDSYRQILRSSSIMGGAAGLNYLIGLLRVKIVAVLIGPSGVGLVGLYTSAVGLVGTVSSLGIGSSAVREVAQAFSEDDARAVARTVRILRRACWATGMFGWLLALLLAKPISIWLFGSTDQIVALSVLGVTLLLNAVAAGQGALLQGSRRIGDIARANVLGTLLSTVVAIALYAWLGKDGILLVLVATALLSLSVSYWFSRRVRVIPVDLSWADTLRGTKHLLGLGFAFMWSGVMAAALDSLTRSIVTNQFGVHAAGMYQAAWALSAMFAGFILGAMGTDYYPRLTATIHDRALTTRMVNEQTEIGILMALPGLLGTLAFAPLILVLFYTTQFLGAAELLRWLLLGVFARVVSWPIGFILFAKGASRLVLVVETVFAAVQAALLFWFVDKYGLVGAALAFAAVNALHIIAVLWAGRVLIGFAWSSGVQRLVLISSGFICAGLTVPSLMTDGMAVVAGGLITITGSIVSLRGLVERLGSENRLTKWISLVPGVRIILPKTKN